MRQKITAAEIRRLYDALARDMGIGEVDPDLNDPDNLVYDEAFEKAIQRARAMWHIILIRTKIIQFLSGSSIPSSSNLSSCKRDY